MKTKTIEELRRAKAEAEDRLYLRGGVPSPWAHNHTHTVYLAYDVVFLYESKECCVRYGLPGDDIVWTCSVSSFLNRFTVSQANTPYDARAYREDAGPPPFAASLKVKYEKESDQ